MTKLPTRTREIPPIPRLSESAHKGDAGRVVIIGGCTGQVTMIGAVSLAANAAFRSGAGLVQVVAPKEILNAVLTITPCATGRGLEPTTNALLEAANSYQADAISIGSGMGESIPPPVLVEFLRAWPGTIVLDGDGLNTLAKVGPTAIPSPRRIIMTPHPGELARLLAAAGTKAIPKDRNEAALQLLESYGCTVVLKGKGTIVTDGERLYVNETGNPGMATAGSGDVLTGIIAALVGRGMDGLDAAILGVHLHGLSGDFAAEEMGRTSMTALDLITFLPDAFTEHELVE